jgi:putative FmdB family regulatory protein
MGCIVKSVGFVPVVEGVSAMPLYTYRREDGTTFDVRQQFSDAPLNVDPQTGQKVVRVVQAAGVIFKGSGFYVNDSKGAKNSTATPKTDGKTETKSETPPTESSAAPAPAAAPVSSAAD